MRKSLLVRAAFAALTLILLLVPATASAYDFQQGVLSYNILDREAGTVEVARCDRSAVDVNIPASVSYDDRNWAVASIGRWAFNTCFSLTSITIPDGVAFIGNGAFMSCYSLTSITIPDAVKFIDEYAFTECSSLTSIIIPDRVTSIGDYAFKDCSSLASATIGSNVSKIGQLGFDGCSSLSTLTCRAVVPPVCNGEDGWCVFNGVETQQCKLFVPEGSIDAYKAADQWKDFFNVEEISGISDVWTDGAMGREYFDLGGRKVARPECGKVAIEHKSDGTTKKVVMRK